MSADLLLGIVVAAALLALGSLVALSITAYRFWTRRGSETSTDHARHALVAACGVLVAVLVCMWSYHEFIVLKAQF
jgi:cell division protein FtsW (lipid II flippase)